MNSEQVKALLNSLPEETRKEYEIKLLELFNKAKREKEVLVFLLPYVGKAALSHMKEKDFGEYVGGYYQILLFTQNENDPNLRTFLVVNEEGRSKGLPINHLASAMFPHSGIVGNAILVQYFDDSIEEGYAVDLSGKVLEMSKNLEKFMKTKLTDLRK
jgi:hypothetical protein